MKKNYYFGIAAALMMGTVALSSCSSDELAVGNETQIAKEVAKTYSFSIQATMDDEAGTRMFSFDLEDESYISSKFSENEKVYVFIRNNNGDIAYGNKALNPTDVSDDGSSCTIDVSVKDGFYFIPTNFTPAVGDEVYLYYGMTSDTVDHTKGYYSFVTEGTWEFTENMDYNLAVMKITSIDNDVLTFGQIEDETKTNFSFKNINSVFRQKLEIFDENSDEIDYSKITKVVISSASNKMVKRYYPFGDNEEETYEYGPIVIEGLDLTTDGSIYFSTIFIEGENDTDEITFTAYDEDGKTYTNSKGAPTSCFENNVYYYGDVQLFQVSGVISPTISGLNSYEQKPADSGDGSYVYCISDNPADFSISGNSEQNTFLLINGGTVTMKNINATIGNEVTNEKHFIEVGNNENGLTLDLAGDNIITILNGTPPFYGNGATLKLRCSGYDPATLTIRTNFEYDSGFNNFNYTYLDWDSLGDGPLSADVLEEITAYGCTVVRSERKTVNVTIDGNDVELNEWTFTISQN